MGGENPLAIMIAGLRRHFSRYGYLYPVVIAPMTVAFFYGIKDGSSNVEVSGKAFEVRQWPVVEGRVVNAEVQESGLPGETGGVTKITVRARISYVQQGETVVRSYTAAWDRRYGRNWEDFFSPSHGLRIRLSPDGKGRISLIDYNGVP